MIVGSVSVGAGMLAFLALGAILGAGYDLLCIWRALFRSGRRAVWIQDFAFMILAAYATFLLCLGVCFGELRLYLFFCEAFCCVLWHETAGRVSIPFFRRLFRFLHSRFFGPLCARFRKNEAVRRKRMEKFAGIARKWLGNQKKGLKPGRSLVYNYRAIKRKRLGLRKERRARKMKVLRGKKKRSGKSFLLRFAVFVFSAYILVLLVQQQAKIQEKKQQLASVERQIQIQEIRNDDLQTAAGSGSSDYYEKAARTDLDYSRPGERVYVNIAGK